VPGIRLEGRAGGPLYRSQAAQDASLAGWQHRDVLPQPFAHFSDTTTVIVKLGSSPASDGPDPAAALVRGIDRFRPSGAVPIALYWRPAPLDRVPQPGWRGDPSVVHQDQAVITASGQFSWRAANLGMAPPGQPDITLMDGQTYHLQGWTIAPAGDGTTFTNDETGHGMVIDRDDHVKPF
jgi:hypothetical protein